MTDSIKVPVSDMVENMKNNFHKIKRSPKIPTAKHIQDSIKVAILATMGTSTKFVHEITNSIHLDTSRIQKSILNLNSKAKLTVANPMVNRKYQQSKDSVGVTFIRASNKSGFTEISSRSGGYT